MKEDDLFSLAAARIERDKALARVEENADEQWKEVALGKVYIVALERSTFTVDDVQQLMKYEDVSTHENRAMGPVMMAARKKGWIESTGTMVQSKQRQCHAGPRTLWHSLITNNIERTQG